MNFIEGWCNAWLPIFHRTKLTALFFISRVYFLSFCLLRLLIFTGKNSNCKILCVATWLCRFVHIRSYGMWQTSDLKNILIISDVIPFCSPCALKYTQFSKNKTTLVFSLPLCPVFSLVPSLVSFVRFN